MQSRRFLRLRGGLLPWLLPCGFALAACEDAEPPASCGFIPQLTVAVDESSAVTACFNDPNGDRLSYRATSSDPGVATASASGNTITVTGVAPGNASVSVTAADPGGLEGSLVFRVMVPNRPPVAVGFIPAFNTLVGDTGSLDVTEFFHEPDGQSLTYTVDSSDPAVATGSVAGSVVTLRALGVGTSIAQVRATDPGGLYALQPVTVTVRQADERFRDDFDTSASLDKWLVSNATAVVRQGVLELASPDGASVAGLAERALTSPLYPWRIDVSMGRRSLVNSFVSVWWWTGDPVYSILSFEIGPQLSNNYNLFVFDMASRMALRIVDFSGASDAVKEGSGELTDIELSFSGGRFRGVAGTTELFNAKNSLIPRSLTAVALVSRGAPNATVLFDWFEVDGTMVNTPAFDWTVPKAPAIALSRQIRAVREFRVVDTTLEELFGPGG
ncbi:MAG: Ig-like domain-containing protein [Gemmatimonadota bacterium]|nr:Ig-like domain-containing protein [Gemmatimonadota bacterium]